MHTESTAEETDGTASGTGQCWCWGLRPPPSPSGCCGSKPAKARSRRCSGRRASSRSSGPARRDRPVAVGAPSRGRAACGDLPLMILMTVTLGVSTWTQPGLAGAISFIMPLRLARHPDQSRGDHLERRAGRRSRHGHDGQRLHLAGLRDLHHDLQRRAERCDRALDLEAAPAGARARAAGSPNCSRSRTRSSHSALSVPPKPSGLPCCATCTMP